MDKQLIEKAVDFHGHSCGGLAIGIRVCEALFEKLHIAKSKDEEIVCVTENDTCAVDAVQALVGCTFGKGNLIYKPQGIMAFNFYLRNSGKSLRIYLKADRDENYNREQWKNYVINAPIDELFSFSKPKHDCPEKARIFNSVKCSVCGEKAREDKIRLKDGKFICLNCFNEYDR